MQLIEEGLTIIERANRIQHDNKIERAGKRSDCAWIFRVTDNESQIRMPFTRLRDHRRTEIQSDPERRFEACQRIANSTSDFKDARPFRNQKAQIVLVFAVKKTGLFSPCGASTCVRLGMFKNSRFAGRLCEICHDSLNTFKCPAGLNLTSINSEP